MISSIDIDKARNLIKNAEKIAIVRTDKIGDMILTLPLISSIKKLCPQAEITLISASYTNDITENLDFIDRILNKDKFSKGLKDIFKEFKPDVVFFPRPRFDEIKDAYFAGIKLRIGSAYRWYSFFLNFKIRDHRKISEFHEAEYNLRMLENITGTKGIHDLPDLYYNGTISFDNLLEENLSTGKKPDAYFIVHPGSGGSANDWDAGKMGELSQLLSERFNLLPIITGTKSETDKCDNAKEKSVDAMNLCGKLSLKMLKPLIKHSAFLISNSTGIIHIAAALKVPVIGFYPNTPHISAKRWGPYADNKIIISPENSEENKFNDNMSTISVKFAFDKILENNILKNYDKK
jgi:ADP-heptose:LPS heptosyltransferase